MTRVYTSDPRLQREAEAHGEAYRMNWLQGFPFCLARPCFYGGGVLSSYRGFLLFKLRAISLTACAWDMTILKPYCMERDRETERMWSENLHKGSALDCTGNISCSKFMRHIWLWVVGGSWYLVVHDCSQAHDAHMHIILLTHEAGVLDGFAIRDWAVAATDSAH